MHGKQQTISGAATEPTEPEVLVVGAGPTGLMLAAELALAGVTVVVVERRADRSLEGSRAMGFGARTLELLDQRGVAGRFLAEGTPMQIQLFAGSSLDISDFPSRHPHGLAIPQARVEALLAEWVDELPVTVLRGRALTAIEQDASAVHARLDDGSVLRAQYAVGCDGGRSLVRAAADIPFEGWDASTSYLLAEGAMPDQPALGFKEDAQGKHAIGPDPQRGPDRVRLVVQEQPPKRGDRPALPELRAAVERVWGSDFGLRDVTWISRFSDAARQAASYRQHRLLVAGDAAHVHSPMGGQGLNTGVQDAVNLGWKLAHVVKGWAGDALLDTYHEERHPVGAWVLQSTLAQTAASRVDARTAALRSTLAELLAMDEPRRHMAGLLSGLGIRYDLGGQHPLVGWRMPDLELHGAGDASRVFDLLHDARGVLLDLTTSGQFDITPWDERVQLVQASCDGPWELPVGGHVHAADAVLVRPDGYVAWAGALDDPDLLRALTTWFGEPAA